MGGGEGNAGTYLGSDFQGRETGFGDRRRGREIVIKSGRGGVVQADECIVDRPLVLSRVHLRRWFTRRILTMSSRVVWWGGGSGGSLVEM
jgi:hypothetical protein